MDFGFDLGYVVAVTENVAFVAPIVGLIC